MTTIPPRYAYSAVAAFAIGAAVILYAYLPPAPPPPQPTLKELTAKALDGKATPEELTTLGEKLTPEEGAALVARMEAYNAELRTKIATDKWAREHPTNSPEDVQRATRELDRMLSGAPSAELVERCLRLGHSVPYCNRQ